MRSDNNAKIVIIVEPAGLLLNYPHKTGAAQQS